MHFSSVLMPLAIASTTLFSAVLATPAAWPPVRNYPGGGKLPVGWHGGPDSAPGKFCLTDADAQTIVDGFVNMLENTMENFNVTLANTLLADDFSDYSDSINYLKRTPLGEVSFASKQEFIDGQGTQPPFPSVETLNMFHTCDSIAWRWQGNYAPLWIRGINMFLINEKKQIKTVLVEMNSGAFLKNVGKPECDPGIAYYN
jgi:hypothetical protein